MQASSQDGGAPSPQNEIFAQLSAAQQQPPQSRTAGDSSQHLAGFLQQQGAIPGSLNLADPAHQAHVFHLLSQLGPQAWGGSINQPNNNSQTLEAVLAHISRHPELAASLPTLLNSISGQQSQPQPTKVEGSNPLQIDAPPGGFTAQLYGTSAPGMGSDASDKLDSQQLALNVDVDPAAVKANSVKCAKEKNRQAQRRFRERQKGLILELKERAESLQKQVESQRRQIETLEKENQVLKVILQEKNKT